MKRITCTACCADEFKEENGYRICVYCGARYKLENTSSIGLNDDIASLLHKCQEEPQNARKYANLILDIDPTNTKALKFLNR